MGKNEVWLIEGDAGDYDEWHTWTEAIATSEEAAFELWRKLTREQITPDLNRKIGYRWAHRDSASYAIYKWTLDDPDCQGDELDLDSLRVEFFGHFQRLRDEYLANTKVGYRATGNGGYVLGRVPK